jgi:hypothetical protein
VTVRVGQLTKLISHEEKFKDSDILNLWKINAEKCDLNTEDDIKKLGSKLMEFEQSFVNYFPNVPYAKDVNIHIYCCRYKHNCWYVSSNVLLLKHEQFNCWSFAFSNSYSF